MTPTTYTRSGFLKSIALLAFAPLAVGRALVKPTLSASVPKPNTRLCTDGRPDVQEALRRPRTIKVPSNRSPIWVQRLPGGEATKGHTYVGPWDGTFKLEEGCTNPAYILADLMTNGAPAEDQHALVDWRATYHWGTYLDQTATSLYTEEEKADGTRHWCPYSEVSCLLVTEEDRAKLRDHLRMEFLSWQASDPRYRSSFPGIPYPET